MTENNPIKATITLARLYENQGLIADAIATYETIYSSSPTEELFEKLQVLKHDFISSDSTDPEDSKSILSFLLSKHEKEYFRILSHTQYKKYKDAYDPDNSDLDIKIEFEDDEEIEPDIFEVTEDNIVSGESLKIPKPKDPIFQEVLDNIEKGPQDDLLGLAPDETNDEPVEDMLNENLVVRDLITHLQRVYGDDTLIKDINQEELLNSVSTFLK